MVRHLPSGAGEATWGERRLWGEWQHSQDYRTRERGARGGNWLQSGSRNARHEELHQCHVLSWRSWNSKVCHIKQIRHIFGLWPPWICLSMCCRSFLSEPFSFDPDAVTSALDRLLGEYRWAIWVTKVIFIYLYFTIIRVLIIVFRK